MLWTQKNGLIQVKYVVWNIYQGKEDLNNVNTNQNWSCCTNAFDRHFSALVTHVMWTQLILVRICVAFGPPINSVARLICYAVSYISVRKEVPFNAVLFIKHLFIRFISYPSNYPEWLLTVVRVYINKGWLSPISSIHYIGTSASMDFISP